MSATISIEGGPRKFNPANPAERTKRMVESFWDTAKTRINCPLPPPMPAVGTNCRKFAVSINYGCISPMLIDWCYMTAKVMMEHHEADLPTYFKKAYARIKAYSGHTERGGKLTTEHKRSWMAMFCPLDCSPKEAVEDLLHTINLIIMNIPVKVLWEFATTLEELYSRANNGKSSGKLEAMKYMLWTWVYYLNSSNFGEAITMTADISRNSFSIEYITPVAKMNKHEESIYDPDYDSPMMITGWKDWTEFENKSVDIRNAYHDKRRHTEIMEAIEAALGAGVASVSVSDEDGRTVVEVKKEEDAEDPKDD
jgi:hypothetical protein